jgi:hypothetical protein
VKSLEASLALGVFAMLLALFMIFRVPTLPKPTLPKPTPNCPDCRDATVATVKE